MPIKRVAAVFFVLILLFSFLTMRIYLIMSGADSDLLAFIASQRELTVPIYESRGLIYDKDLKPLVEDTDIIKAVIDPLLVEDKQTVLDAVPPSLQAEAQKDFEKKRPFSIQINKEFNIKGINCFMVAQRYNAPFNAVHLLGYLDNKGAGALGIEKAFDSLLKSDSIKFSAKSYVDGARRTISGLGMRIEGEYKKKSAGVVLTIDKQMQKIADEAADAFISAGAIVILDTKTGEIRAMSSRPTYNPYNINSAYNQGEGAFVNRALNPYNVGSAFKIVDTAAYNEGGGDLNVKFYCGGSINVGTNNIACDKKDGHGTIGIMEAFAQSCNVYFIQLAQKAGAQAILDMAQKMGFGTETALATGITSNKGNLPTIKNLSAPAALANFAIGQGDFLATPLQVAEVVSVVAYDGSLRTPYLVKGICDENMTVSDINLSKNPVQVISQNTAQKIRELMIYTATNGTGFRANPDRGGAGIKTATAQTGIMKNGQLITQGWIAGFFPSENPQYAVAIVAEDAESGSKTAGPAFKYIAEKGYDYIISGRNSQ